MTENIEAPTPAPKLDPQALAIRVAPRRAIRFKRGVIVGLAALGSTSLAVVAWLALKPVSFVHAVSEQEMSQPAPRSAPDALGGLPTSYANVPKLGPPLPGDLGRPILDHERSLQLAEDPSAQQAGQAAASQHAAHVAELKAARESGVLFQNRQGISPATEPPVQAVTQPATAVSLAGATAPDHMLALDPEHDPNAQGHAAAFAGTPDKDGPVDPHRLTPATSPYMLSAGSVIAASLITGLRSDVPGLVTAQVTERVYDSATGRILLIPQGARLIGRYDSVVAFGQKRALVIWQRIILPDGSSLTLDNVPATDASGYAGLQDKVDFHSWRLLQGAVLSTLLGVGSELAFTGQGNLVQAIRRSTQDTVSRTGDQIVKRNLDVQPALTIRPGAPVRLVVNHDLILAPWRD